jgi:hypothetical protein
MQTQSSILLLGVGIAIASVYYHAPLAGVFTMLVCALLCEHMDRTRDRRGR